MEKLFADAIAAVGKPDIAINTVGKVLKKPITEISETEYDEMSAVNSKSAFFFLREAGKHVNDNGKICTLVTSLLGAYTPYYAAYAGTKAPVEHFTRAASKEFGARGISVTAVGPGPMDTPFFYPAEGADAVDYLKNAAALSPFSKTGLTDIDDVVPFIRHLVSEGCGSPARPSSSTAASPPSEPRSGRHGGRCLPAETLHARDPGNRRRHRPARPVPALRQPGMPGRRSLPACLPTWLAVALVNLWVGVQHAGYGLREELPILLLVFLVPAALAGVAIWLAPR